MIYKKITQKAAALLLGAVLLCGCSIKVGTNTTPKPGDAVAKASEESGGADITYREFSKRYAFSLMEYGIEDDSAESVADACKALRQNIINNLIIEKIFLKKAEEMGVDTLPDNELTAVTAQYNEQMAAYEERYGAEEFDSMLESCGLARGDLLEWLTNYAVEMHVTDEIMAQVDYAEAEASVNEFVEKAKQLYSTNIMTYQLGEYYELWVPDGSRMIKHIVMNFDDGTVNQIKELRESGDNDAADALRNEKAGELYEGRVREFLEALDSDEDYLTLLLTYADNGASASLDPDGVLVFPEDTRYDEKFLEMAFGGFVEIGEVCYYPDDSSVNILIYAADAKVSAEDLKSITDDIYGSLKEIAFDNTVAEWNTEFAYEIDKQKLRLDS